VSDHAVVLRLGPGGLGSVQVDGHELGHLTTAVHVHSVVDEPLRVVLELLPEECRVEGTDAAVQVFALTAEEPYAADRPRRTRAMCLAGPLTGADGG